MRRITLFEPRYPHGRVKTYLPGGLMNLGSRLLEAGIEVSFFDLNHTDLESPEVRSELDRSNFVGWSVIGTPYIPDVMRDIARVRFMGYQQLVLVGGEGINNLHCPADFTNWFSRLGQVVPVTTDQACEQALDLAPGSLRSAFDTSSVRMLMQLTEAQRRLYLTSEFALFLANGCMFNCSFCAAAKNRPEQYRSLRALEEEVEYICSSLVSIGHSTFTAYLTNLDVFQSVDKLELCLAAVSRIARRHGIVLHLRGLATSKWTVRECRKDLELATRLRSYGLETVGFGADGGSEAAFRRVNKGHNTLSEAEEFLRLMQEAGIEPEMLTVVGFPADMFRDVFLTLRFVFRHALRGVVIRPYCARAYTPSGEWPDDNPQVEEFRKNPKLLIRLDYTMLACKETHPLWPQRWRANIAYLLIVLLLTPFRLCRTSPLVPVPRWWLGRKIAQFINRHASFER